MKAATNALAQLPSPAGALTETNGLRDIKPLVDIPNPWLWVGWGIVLLALAAAALWAWHYWRRQRALPPTVPLVPPHVRARQKLAAALSLIHDPRAFVIAVSDALRLYLEERFNYRAPERTTEEFLAELATATSLYPDQKHSLADFLQSCDLVKFARHEPSEEDLRQLHAAALRLVDETQFDNTAGTPQPPAAVR